MTRCCRIGWTQRLVGIVGVVSLASPALAGSSDRSAAAETTVATASAAATAQSSQEIATLEAFRGGVTVIRLGLSQTPSPSMPLELNDIVVTKQGRATVRFHSDGSLLRIGPVSRVQINESATERDITVFFGRIWAHIVRWQARVSRFRSNSTIAAIRGTEVSLAVAVDGDETELSVLEGQVEAETDSGSLMLTGGQSAVGRKGVAPTLRVRVRPQDAVQWALYYLPVIYIKPSELGEGPWQDRVRASSEAYLEGDLQRAIDMLDGVEVQTIRDPRFFTYRASLLLATGSVEEAGEDIGRALTLAANDSDALALQTIIAVANNEAENALATAQKSVETDPSSATARIALSYAHQALFDLEGARESLETAVEIEPSDALTWGRLAEIRSSQGYLDEALEVAHKAVELEPNLSRTQTVLGYAYLTRVQTREAQEACRKAIELDQDDPLPRLGLGLALIRKGELSEGSREIEVAVSLDPGQAVVRSYLGKAYFEAKRTGLDEREYDVAKELDPNDPTPWFYDAIFKQTTNRPIEALHALQRSIELNDNRAVYRSRLLLDRDLATRSTSLGRIYSDLGFEQVGLIEASKSLSLDPAEDSAHRLLSDTYVGLPRHDLARGSELLQAQLLQPINSNPVRPSRAASAFNIAAGAGPSDAGFNEFSPLFERNRWRLLTSVFGGNNSTWGDEVVLSGLYDRWAASLGQFHADTGGFRTNSDAENDLYNAFFQVAVTPALDLQAEYQRQESEAGDLRLRFFTDDRFPLTRQGLRHDSGRIGTHLKLSPRSDIIVSALYAGVEERETFFSEGGFEDTFLEESAGFEVESQYLFRGERFNLTAGFGIYETEVDRTATFRFTFDEEDFTFSETDSFDRKRHSAYLYGNLNWPKALVWTLGISYDALDEGDTDVLAAVNPKLGLQWDLTQSIRLRAAFVENDKQALLGNPTIEPTEVAGFNQFFDDLPGTESRRYGAGLDVRLGEGFYAGVEGSRRDLEVPFFFTSGELFDRAEWKEELYRGYLYWTPSPRWAASAEYRWDTFEVKEGPGSVLDLDTISVPLSIRYYHPAGFFARLGATYVRQEIADLSVVVTEASDDFVVVDAALGYRLPKRLGIMSLGVRNLLDEEFRFQDDSFRSRGLRRGLVTLAADENIAILEDFRGNFGFVPDRVIFAAITLSF